MSAASRYSVGDFVLERVSQRVLQADGTPLTLTPRLFDALLLFVERPGELLDKDWLMRSLWPGLVVEENNLSQVISGLRRALGDDAQGSRYIQTVPRRGFRLVAPVLALPSLESGVTPGEPPPPAAPDPASEVAIPPEEEEVVSALPGGRRPWLVAALALGVVGAAGFGGWVWRRDVTPPWTPPAPAPAGGRLAVLPFKPLLTEGRDELLELGMADSLATQLSSVPGLLVRSVSSVRRYSGIEQDPLRAARELEVDWIVDGTLQQRSDRVYLNARLLRAADGIAAWSAGFDAPRDGVFDLQNRIATQVRDVLAPTLGARAGGEQPLTELGGTRSTAAYELYMVARWRAQGGRRSNIDRAITLLHQAIEIDPNYALAWTELAWVDRRRLWSTDGVPTEVFEASNISLQRALAIAPGLPQARAGLGFSRYWFDFDWPAGEREFRAVLEVNPNVVNAHWGMAQMLLTQGRIEEGFVHMRAARQLDPMSPVLNTLEGSFLLNRGLIDEARIRLNRAVDIAPEQWMVRMGLGLLRMAERRPEQGIAEFRRAVALAEGCSRPSAMLATQLAGLGQREEARAIRDELLATSRQRYLAPTSLAAVHAALGERELALAALERALSTRDTRLVYLKDDPHWASLRGEPRFKALMHTLALDRFGPGLMSI